MEITPSVLAGLKLINSDVVEQQFLEQVLENVHDSLVLPCNSSNNNSFSGESAIVYNTLTFTISSLILDAAKYGLNIEKLCKLLQNNQLNTSTELFKLVINFIDQNLSQIVENLTKTELNPNPKFTSLFWSQKIDVKSSNVDNIRDRNFILDFNHRLSSQNDHFEIEINHKELNDLYLNLRDCTRSIEQLLNK